MDGPRGEEHVPQTSLGGCTPHRQRYLPVERYRREGGGSAIPRRPKAGSGIGGLGKADRAKDRRI